MNNDTLQQINQFQDQMSSPIKLNCLRTIQIFITEFSYILLICLILFIIYIIPSYHSKKTFTSKNSQEFQFSQDPIILIQATDLHISTRFKEKIDSSTVLLMSLCEYNPDIFLLTGDYVDNYKKGQKFGTQNLEDWKIYNASIRSNLIKKGFKVIDISGNHDLWAVKTVNSKENNFLDNSFIYNRTTVKNESDFFLRKEKVC